MAGQRARLRALSAAPPAGKRPLRTEKGLCLRPLCAPYDRFFDNNRALAKEFLTHPYFEVRAVAAKYVEVFYLPRLLDDRTKRCAGVWRNGCRNAC